MKKITLTAILAAAGFVLGGCGLANGHGEDSVNISDLKRGYIISGYFDNNKNWEIFFCGDRYDVGRYDMNSESYKPYKGGTYSYDGEAIVFSQIRPKADKYELHVGANKRLELQHYTFSQNNQNNKEFTIANIARDNSSYNYVCKE